MINAVTIARIWSVQPEHLGPRDHLIVDGNGLRLEREQSEQYQWQIVSHECLEGWCHCGSIMRH